MASERPQPEPLETAPADLRTARPLHVGLVFAIVAVAALAVLFAFYDQAISLFIVDPDSVWGRFVARYGELPGVCSAAVAFFLLGLSRPRAPVRAALVIIIGAATATGALATYGAYLGGLAPGASGVAFAAIGAGLALASALALIALRPRVGPLSPRVARFARIMALTAVIALVAVLVLKALWGRARFRDLEAGVTMFTPWFIPQGVTGHTSFPSGHTLWGWMVLPTFLLVPRERRLQRDLAIAACVAWGVFVAVGRVRIGAHYASDVLFATAISLLVFKLVHRAFVGTP